MPFSILQDISWLPIADAVTKATLLLGIAGLSATLLRRRSAATRHLVWTLALLAVLALPVLSLTLPRWQVPLLRFAGEQPMPPSDAAAAPPVLRRADRPASNPTATPSASTAAPAAEASTSPVVSLNDISWPSVLLVLWLVGVAAVLGRLLFGVAAVHWLARRTESAEDSPWFEHACRLANEVGVSSRVRFLRSTRARMPMAVGVVRPSILMPADADAWPCGRLRIVLLHELAHVKRRDCLTHALVQIACALYWFNPLVWIAARHVRTERERACDDLVLASGTHGPDYADQLLEIARVMRAGRFPAVLAGASLAMAYRSQLEGRLMAILDPKVPRAGMTGVRVAALTALGVALVLPLASVQPWAYTEAQEQAATVSANQPAAGAPAVVAESQQQSAPAPAPSPKPGRAIRDEQGAVQGAIQGSMQGAIQGSMQGAIQGALQGTTQGVIQGVRQAVTSGAVDEHTLNEAALNGLAAAMPLADHVIAQAEIADKPTRRSKADPKTVAALTAALKDTDADVRQAALDALVQMRDPSIYEPLMEALKDANADVRQQAVFALGQLRDPSAVDALIGAVRDTNADVREQAVFALGQIRDRRGVESLISALKDTNPDVRQQAAFALGQTRDRSAVEPLVIALKDSNADVRQQAAFALGQLDDPRAIDGLTEALKDPSADVRQQAAFALGQLAR